MIKGIEHFGLTPGFVFMIKFIVIRLANARRDEFAEANVMISQSESYNNSSLPMGKS